MSSSESRPLQAASFAEAFRAWSTSAHIGPEPDQPLHMGGPAQKATCAGAPGVCARAVRVAFRPWGGFHSLAVVPSVCASSGGDDHAAALIGPPTAAFAPKYPRRVLSGNDSKAHLVVQLLLCGRLREAATPPNVLVFLAGALSNTGPPRPNAGRSHSTFGRSRSRFGRSHQVRSTPLTFDRSRTQCGRTRLWAEHRTLSNPTTHGPEFARSWSNNLGEAGLDLVETPVVRRALSRAQTLPQPCIADRLMPDWARDGRLFVTPSPLPGWRDAVARQEVFDCQGLSLREWLGFAGSQLEVEQRGRRVVVATMDDY